MKIGTTELIIILVVVVLIFGPTQIPKLSRMIGKSIKNLRAGMSDGEEETAENVGTEKKADKTGEAKGESGESTKQE